MYIFVKPKEVVCQERAQKAADIKYGDELALARARVVDGGHPKHRLAFHRVREKMRMYKQEMNEYFLNNFKLADDMLVDPNMASKAGLSSASTLLSEALKELGL